IINSVDKRSSQMPPLEDLHKFFKKLNSEENNQTSSTFENQGENLREINEEINRQISHDEILAAIKNLKNNKSPGPDNVLNEHLKSTIDLFLPIYGHLFNLILDSGIVPESWALGDILPIYKNKGCMNLPENYRPITLLSCLGKLFTSILNKRLYNYVEKYEIICHNQAGFRKGLSTVDNLFVLHSLFEMSKSCKNKLLCAFIDFKQAFDNVWRDGLWYKLQKYAINGKCLNLIKNMYSNIKSRVTTPEGNSAFFPCNKGVRQGENLSPILFSLYLNDLETYLMTNGANGIVCEANAEYVLTYIKLLILLFADDTVLFSNDKNDLQSMLNLFERYCDNWKLTVNLAKTKVLIFTSGRYAQNLHFFFKGEEIEIVKEYKYLGIYLSKSGSFLNCKKHIAEQANNALFSLLRKIRVLNLPIEMQIDLFNKLIKPILLYGCEIWAFGNLDIIERVQLKFIKRILHLKKSTPSYMVYGETGLYPLKIDAQARTVSFWSNLLELNSQKLSSIIYTVLHTLYEQGKCKSSWLENVKNLVSSNGYANIWQTQSCMNKLWFCKSFKQKVKDQYLQQWNSLINTS
ncbi:MAG: reverse transcriptase family protein, partial [Candidatus Thiodiazotropha endolucinida]|nr:reverse transcriptase family protein [Candidatus Thiodiazotropha endolucinida]